MLALGLPWKNPGRYVEATSDLPDKLWQIGRQKPKEGIDFKRGVTTRGGNRPFLVRRAFLKKVLVHQYKYTL